MTTEQQRSVDQAIIDGRLVDAIAAFRAATGAGLADAEQYVRKRSAAVTGAPPPADLPPPSRLQMSSSSSLPPSAVKGILIAVAVIVVLSVVVPLAITAGALAFSFKAFNLGSAMTITSEPYYPDVVREIQNDPKFKGALGAPIVVDDGNVFCNQISDNSVQHLASCTMPVHGPKGNGSVRVQIVDQATSLSLGAWLTAGGRTIPISR